MKHFVMACLLSVMAACSSPKSDIPETDLVAFTGATIIDGNGGDPINDATLIISKGKIIDIGKRASVSIPDGVPVTDLKGKFIIPGIINGHGHVGDVKGIDGGKYSKENIIDNLSIYARYGVTTVVSLGGDKLEAEALRAVNDTLPGHARLYIAGDIIGGNTPEEGIEATNKNQAMGVDWMKIRVDDNLGSSPKMKEEVYRAVIARSHELGYKIATHMYYLEDAKKLLDAGADLMAHSVRDLPVDEPFIKVMKDKKAGYCPTLTRELSTFVYGETPEFFNDPFFTKEYDSATIAPLKDAERQKKTRESKGAQTYKKQLPVAMANLKTLSDNGIAIVFGTDSGVPTRFIGYFEHIEMAMMAEAGMTPMQIIQSASKTAAEMMGLKNVGTLTTGNWADFIVLTNDPLTDIKNTRSIESVWIGGKAIN